MWEDSEAGSGRQGAWRKTRRDFVDVAKEDVKLAGAREEDARERG